MTHLQDQAERPRITKYLSRTGACSRREAERLIAAGQVEVNGVVVSEKGLKVSAQDRIKINGQAIPELEEARLWLFHKPVGCLVARSDPQGRKTVFDLLPEKHRGLIAVGRLDLTSEGLLLLTNDGGLARTLELPATGLERCYRVRVFGRLSPSDRKKLATGIEVDGQTFGPIRVTDSVGSQHSHAGDTHMEPSQGKRASSNAGRASQSVTKQSANRWLEVRLNEGRNREVRRALGAVGLKVSRLIRIGYGPFALNDLRPGVLVAASDWQDALGDAARLTVSNAQSPEVPDFYKA